MTQWSHRLLPGERTAWPSVAIAGGATVAAYFLVPAGSVAQGLLYVVASAVVVILVVEASAISEVPTAWRLVAAALLLWGATYAVVLAYPHLTDHELPFPSPADAGHLGGYPLVVAGVLLLLRHRAPAERSRDALLDAALITTAVGTVVWELLVPGLTRAAPSPLASAVSTAYPLMDVLLFGVAVRLLLDNRPRTPSLRLILTALVLLLVGDLIYLLVTLTGAALGYTAAGIHLTAQACLATAVVHPSAATRARPVSPSVGRLSWQRLSVLTAACLLAPAVLAMQAALGSPVDVPVLVAGWVALFLLAALRLAGLAGAAAQQEAEARFRAGFDEALVGMALVSLDSERLGSLLRVNRSLCEITGRDAEELRSCGYVSLVHPQDRLADEEALRAFASGERASERQEKRLLRADGQLRKAVVGMVVVPDANEQPAYLMLSVEDVTERRLAEEHLAFLALHDPLTGMPNRAAFLDRLAHSLRPTRRHRSGVGLLLVDIDHFKDVNDSLGHAAGDGLLNEVARRLRAAARPEDTVARLAGDEFVVLLEDLPHLRAAEVVAQRVQAAMTRATCLAGRTMTLSVSIGVAFRHEGDRPKDLLREADIAMYQAKARGRGRYVVYDDSLRAASDQLDRTEHALRQAAGRSELTLRYQPIIELDTGRPIALEALLRWQAPGRGLLAPPEFLSIAEDSGLIIDLGTWALREALAQGQRWRSTSRDSSPTRIGVNVAARQLLDPGFLDVVLGALRLTDTEPARLCLEVTETALIEVLDSAVSVLGELRRHGVEIALDDFGTGYSSLTHLRQLPVQTLKIDRSFVAGIAEESADAFIVKGVIDLAHALDLRTVAEGVETSAQLAVLRKLGCDFGQGYLWAPPLEATEAFSGWVRSAAADRGLCR